MTEDFAAYRIAASYLQNKLKENNVESPLIGIICGSGLSELSKALEGPTLVVKYGDIPGFPAHCTVPGHKGEIVFGRLGDVSAMCFRGRFHSYEGYDMKTVVLPITVMRCLCVKAVIITNAAGGLNPDFNVGDVMCVSDHFAIPQLAGKNSLVGPNDEELGPRFPPTSNAYNEEFRQATLKAAKHLGLDFLKESGTYCFVSGPMFESKAECRFLRMSGGDTVGMSTIPEVVTAHYCGMQVLCLSLVTNKVIMKGDEGPAASHAEVLEATAKRSIEMQSLVKEIIKILRDDFVLDSLPDLAPVSLDSKKFKKKKQMSLDAGMSFGMLVLAAACLTTGILIGRKS